MGGFVVKVQRGIPLLRAVAVDGTALLFTAMLASATGLLFGIVPALSLSDGREAQVLGGAGRGSSESRSRVSIREFLVVLQVSLALVLLVGAGLLLRSFLALLDVDLGFRPESTVAWEIEPGRPFADDAERLAFHEQLTREVARVPGIVSVGMSDTLPLGRNRSWGVWVKGEVYEEGEQPDGFPRVVDRGYIPTMRIPLIAGRNFTADDTADKEQVVIVNEAMARRLWPSRDRLGRFLLTAGREWRVVGVVGNVRHSSLEEAPGFEMYLHHTQTDYSSMQLVVRGSLPPESLIPSVSAALRAAAPELPTGQFQTLDEIVDRAVSPRRFLLLLLSAFALTALVLAALGIYGVLSYAVSQRSREIGIRMALGASARRVQSSVVLRSLAMTVVGILAGCVASLALSRGVATLLYGVRPMDPATVGLVMLLMLATSGLAAYLPARRASRIEPMSVLRLS